MAINVYQESPGVYFEHLGHATLSNTPWTIVAYVPLHTVDGETASLEQYVQYLDKTCFGMIVRNWTACSHFGDIMAYKLRQIRKTRELLSDITQREDGNRQGDCLILWARLVRHYLVLWTTMMHNFMMTR